MKEEQLLKLIEVARRSIALQQDHLATLDKVFVAVRQHMTANRKPKLNVVSINSEK